ncbi:uncharacterized protein LOC119670316 isoform X2 [Teleopsis dalmanni]|uniref:uncharacterized protein LOC119670316 isoform X2 n=1 Tax=Teleopsis dalmanni TaxID=139649 RepID=UPI0018CC907E|nr:uncharacterized protein LOC119670316 isoform X2 [Teleopsis dalmanni]
MRCSKINVKPLMDYQYLIYAAAAPRQENKGPLRMLKSLGKLRQNKNAAVDRAKQKSQYDEVLMAKPKNLNPKDDDGAKPHPVHSKVNFARNAREGIQRKFSTSPNNRMKYKNTYSSPVESSAGVFRHDSIYYANSVENNKVLARNQDAELPRKKNNNSLNNYTTTRNQHMTVVKNRQQGTSEALTGFSKSFKNDLMEIDSIIKQRIAIGKKKNDESERPKDPMHKWLHPPADQLLSCRNERNILNFEVIEQQRRLQEIEMERQTKLLQKLDSHSSNVSVLSKSIKGHSDPFSVCNKFRSSKVNVNKSTTQKKTKPETNAENPKSDKALKMLNKTSAVAAAVSSNPKPIRGSHEGRFNHIAHLNRPFKFIHTSSKHNS